MTFIINTLTEEQINCFDFLKQYMIDNKYIKVENIFYFHQKILTSILNDNHDVSDKLLYSGFPLILETDTMVYKNIEIHNVFDGIVSPLNHEQHSLKSEIVLLSFVLSTLYDNYKVSCNGDIVLSQGKNK